MAAPVPLTIKPERATGAAVTVAAPARGSDFADLMRRVRAAGLLERRRGYYWAKIAVTAGLLVAAWTVFVVVGDSWWQLTVAAFLAVVFTQVGFLGHDAGHRQIFRPKRANYLVGLLHGNLAVGFSFGWWVDKHSRHHAHPNTEDKDPDIDIGALAFTAGQAVGKRGRVPRFIARHQRYLFFPLLLLEAVQLHVSNVQAVVGRGLRHRRWEAPMLGLHAAGYLTAVLLVLSPVKAVVFIVVQQALLGLYLGRSFAPNHKGMPMLTADDQTDFLRRQVITSRNVRGSWLVDCALGGLREFCRQLGLAYCETTVGRESGHAAASFDTAVDELVGRGVGSGRYHRPTIEENSVDRAEDVAWFTDPAGILLPVPACVEGSIR